MIKPFQVKHNILTIGNSTTSLDTYLTFLPWLYSSVNSGIFGWIIEDMTPTIRNIFETPFEKINFLEIIDFLKKGSTDIYNKNARPKIRKLITVLPNFPI